jgi:hypothetical protein
MESNRILADFIGAIQAYKPYVNTDDMEYYMYGVIPSIEDGENEKHYFLPQEMLFDTDWNWLMEVVEKIENISFNKSDIFFNVTIGSGLYCTIQDSNFDGLLEINTSEETRIKTVYQAVLEFIKWYNEQNQ